MRLRILRAPCPGIDDDHPYVVVAKVRRGPVLVYAWPEWKAVFSLRAFRHNCTFWRGVSRWRRPPNLATLPEPTR